MGIQTIRWVHDAQLVGSVNTPLACAGKHSHHHNHHEIKDGDGDGDGQMMT